MEPRVPASVSTARRLRSRGGCVSRASVTLKEPPSSTHLACFVASGQRVRPSTPDRLTSLVTCSRTLDYDTCACPPGCRDRFRPGREAVTELWGTGPSAWHTYALHFTLCLITRALEASEVRVYTAELEFHDLDLVPAGVSGFPFTARESLTFPRGSSLPGAAYESAARRRVPGERVPG